MSNPLPAARSGRIAELDALRGLAALSVLFYHYLTRFGELFHREHPVPVSFSIGGDGVWLFFMLSGYVIFMTLDRSRSVWEFAVGRFSRLFPTFWVAVTVTFAVVKFWGLPEEAVNSHDGLLNLTMVPRLSHVDFVDGAYWSLEPELIFYVCMGALFAWGALKRFRLTLAIWLSVAALAHLVLSTMDGGSSLCRMVGKFKAVSSLEFIHLFAIGMIFYDVRRSGGIWTRGHALLLAAALGMACWYSNASDACVTLALAGTLYLATTGRLRFLNARPLLWLGLISYPLYLAHQSMGYILLSKLDHLGCNPYLASVVVAAGAIGVAALLSYSVEQPVMRGMREAMRQRRSSNPSATSGQPAIPNAAL